MKKIVIVIILPFVLVGIIFLAFRDKTSPDTQGVQSSSESLTIKGSDTEVQLVSNLAEEFSKDNDGNISVTGGGSGVGIASLLNKEIQVANSSRPISADEKQLASATNIDVQEFIVARDGLTIIVNSENEIQELTLEELGKIYKGEITNWKDVGGSDQTIVLYGRQSTSGTYVYFRDAVLKNDYSAEMRNMEGSQAIVDAVESDRNGVGYVGVGYVKDENGNLLSGLRVVPVAVDADSTAVSPLDTDAVGRGEYPIYRPIYQYLSKLPEKGSLLEKFLLFEISDKGKEIISKTGFYTINDSDKEANEKLLEKIK